MSLNMRMHIDSAKWFDLNQIIDFKVNSWNIEFIIDVNFKSNNWNFKLKNHD